MANVFSTARLLMQLSFKIAELGMILLLTIGSRMEACAATFVITSKPLLTNGGFENNLKGWSTSLSNGSNGSFTV
ncbi:MAG: hypothetical protein EOP45_02190 [Sphingobacteriaceae bacterium]|nr:MAG: hypothetical protein EOP45_02190 [Sphingobacteriaceae bacterium]